MKTLTQSQLQAKITEMVDLGRTSIISLETETVPSNLYAGLNGSRKKADKMEVLEGVKPSDFRKVSRFTALVSAKGYIETLKSFASKELDKLKTELQLSTEDIDTQLKIADMIESRKSVNEGVEAKERKNGTTLNGMLGLSSKDEHPLLRVYCRTANKAHNEYFLNGESVNLKSDKWKGYLKASKPYLSSTARELGLSSEPFPLRDFRFENIRKLTVDGETYTIV